jgi:type II secretory pathway component GspD/PulD (secretin)
MIRKTGFFVLFVAAAMAQSTQPERVFRFVHTESLQARQEINNMMRSIAVIKDTTVDVSAGTLLVRGTADQISFAQWLFGELDQAPGAHGTQIYQVAGDYVPDVRVFFLAHATSPQSMQEMMNTLRSIGEIQRVSALNANAAIVVRGTYDQAELAAWLVPLLDLPAGVQPATAPLEHHYNDPNFRFPATAVRVFRLAHTTTPLAMQEIINAVRSIAEVQRATMNTPVATMVIRSTPVQAALTAWMLEQLDQPAVARSAAAFTEYPPGLAGLQPPPARPVTDEIVRVATLARTRTAQGLNDLVSQIRSTARMQRVVYTSMAGALTLRGTAAQMAMAEELIRNADQ